jgi:hypothetical protein
LLPSHGQEIKSEKYAPERWYKGNTHTHTTLSDGNASPEYVENWYHKRGYNFLVLTDHDKIIYPDSVQLSADKRDDFILIPGEEVAKKGFIHSTGLNIKGYVHPGNLSNSVIEVIQSHVDSIRAKSGVPILNHPNYQAGANVNDILPVKRLHLFELYSGYPWSYDWGEDSIHIPMEEKWDSLLSEGYKMYGVAADDAHHYDEFLPDKVNPGRGWVMVRSSKLCPDSIAASMEQGDFYASNGVILKTVKADKHAYTVEIDMDATKEEMKSPYLSGQVVYKGKPGFSIDFIGEGGKILQHTEAASATHQIKGLTVISSSEDSLKGTFATYQIKEEDKYVRCRITYCRKRKRYEEVYEKLYAWTQPVFLKQ